MAWTSFTHGSFFHIGRIYQDVDALGEDPRARERLLATAKAFQQATVRAYVPLGIATIAASGLIIDAIRQGNTAYPRWSGPLVAPLAPIVAATALTATNILPGRARYALQGAGVNLGSIISFGVSTVLLWRNRRAGTTR
jgi:hypothetical protein